MTMTRTLNTMLAVGAVLLFASAGFAADTYKIDNQHSTVHFRIKHLNVSYFHGRFNDISGHFSFDDSDISKSSIVVEVKTNSVDTHDKKRDGHLKSPDFFNAREFPKMTFHSTAIKTAKNGMLEVSGDLMAHGVTKSIQISLERTGAGPDPWGGYRSGFETTLTFKRSDFGMDTMIGPLSDEVRLTVAIEGVRQ